jgi:hypothetical protein
MLIIFDQITAKISRTLSFPIILDKQIYIIFFKYSYVNGLILEFFVKLLRKYYNRHNKMIIEIKNL